MTKIKLCGVSSERDIGAVNEALPDYIGFVFAHSRRQVSFSQAEKLKALLDKRIRSVGVFVNADPDDICMLCARGVLDAVQLHGDEDAAYLRRLKAQIQTPIIRAVRVRSPEQLLKAQTLDCDFLLLDTDVPGGYGGSGKSFDWSLIPKLEKPYFLAGGLHAGNIAAALESCTPYALDISSGAETDRVKDKSKILALVRQVRSMNQ